MKPSEFLPRGNQAQFTIIYSRHLRPDFLILEARDLPDLRRESRSFKSVSRIYGLSQPITTAEGIKQACESESIAIKSIPTLLPQLKTEYGSGTAALKPFLQSEYAITIQIPDK
ncbi:MAG: hypothetical protein M2R45_04421 [Verrucomicrobia subdivision 3 bacterium]|nr:hypothetical protein [Limisphaerales bacterium]MCS1413509.1 hypothetical protein [Limisphaerales bacterium]